MATPPSLDGWPEQQGGGSPGVAYGAPAKPYNAWGFDPQANGAYQRVRGGLEYPILGTRWSPVNNDRDDTKPAITLQMDYKMAFLPLLVALDDGETNDGTYSLNAADAVHRFHFLAAISKRFFLLDPYFVAAYTFPFAASDGVLGIEPRHDAGFRLGMEIVPFENAALDQKFAIDLGLGSTYFSRGRDYSEVSDALGEITYTDEYLRTGAHVGAVFRALQYITIDLYGSILYDTDHFLTTEAIGCDGGCPAPGPWAFVTTERGPQDGRVSLKIEDGERNPYYNPLLDTTGRRLRVEESLRAEIIARASLTF
jgi:hypothetical protein